MYPRESDIEHSDGICAGAMFITGMIEYDVVHPIDYGYGCSQDGWVDVGDGYSVSHAMAENDYVNGSMIFEMITDISAVGGRRITL